LWRRPRTRTRCLRMKTRRLRMKNRRLRMRTRQTMSLAVARRTMMKAWIRILAVPASRIPSV
ncbi:hypothetical protein LPJ62_006342, partial [Coemansia sp. RSA 2167]